MAMNSQALQGRSNSRPWELWLYPIWVARCALGIGIASLIIGIRFHQLAFGGIGAGFAALVGSIAWIVHRMTFETVSMWRKLDEAITVHDPQWRPHRPSVTRTERGLVVIISPVPFLYEAKLSTALSTVALTKGLLFVGFKVLPPKRIWKRSYGRERLRIEMTN